MNKQMARSPLLLMAALLLVASLGVSVAADDPMNPSGRQGNHIGDLVYAASSNPTAMQLVEAMSTPGFYSTVKSAEYEGHPAQKAVFTQSIQGFPLTGSSLTLLSTGIAADAPGTADTFASTEMGGTFKANWGPYGLDAYDLAALSVTVKVPKDASALTFSYKFGTEENPSYLGSMFKDYFSVVMYVPAQGWCRYIPLLPDGSYYLHIDNAAEYSNKVQGSSSSPQPPFPEPNDTVYNAVTELQTVQYDVSSLRDLEIVLRIELADVSDDIYDSAVFLDGFSFVTGEVPDDPLAAGKTVFVKHVKDPQDPVVFYRLPVREGSGLAKKTVDYMQHGNRGVIVSGPVSSDGHTWWEVKWDVGSVKGWSSGTYLSLTPPNPELSAPSSFKVGDEEWTFTKWTEEVIKWAKKSKDDGTVWKNASNITLCMGFTASAFQLKRASSGYHYAIEGAQKLYRFNQEPQGWKSAPKGAVVFFDRTAGNKYGHVGIYLGDNRIVHVTWPSGKVGEDKMDALPSYVGRYIGWTYPPVSSPDWRPTSPPPQAPKAQAVTLESPGSLRVYDAAGRVTGVVDGEIKVEIPGSSYTADLRTVAINPALEDYRIEIHGDADGTYGLRMIRLEGEDRIPLEIRDVSVTPSEIHRYYISWKHIAEGKKGITIDMGDAIINTSMPRIPSDPVPTDEAIDVPANTALSWTGGDHVDPSKDIYYEIYLGPDYALELVAVIGPFPATQSLITYQPQGNPGQLRYDTTYYWSIVAVDQFGIASQGPVWSFTTITVIEAAVTIDPETLNLQAPAKWITAYIELPADYAAEDIDISTVHLLYNGGELYADWGDLQGGVLMVRFDWAIVAGWFDGLHDVDVALTVAGKVDGIEFEGTATIRVIDPPRHGRGRTQAYYAYAIPR